MNIPAPIRSGSENATCAITRDRPNRTRPALRDARRVVRLPRELRMVTRAGPSPNKPAATTVVSAATARTRAVTGTSVTAWGALAEAINHRTQPSHHAEPAGSPLGEIGPMTGREKGLCREGHPQIRRGRQRFAKKRRGHDADDGKRHAVQRQGRADDRRLALKLRSPEGIADNG